MATKIDNDYMIKHFDYDVNAHIRTTLNNTAKRGWFDETYNEVVGFAIEKDHRVQSAEDVEARLDNETRKENFRRAQAYQLIYDVETERNAPLPEQPYNQSYRAFDWSSQTIRIMRNLGFYQRGEWFV